jgi:hypothetical protein
MRVVTRKKHDQRTSVIQGVKDPVAKRSEPALLAFREPGRVSRLRSFLSGMLPYHRQAWEAGTLFNSPLQASLTALEPSVIESRADDPAAAKPGAEEVSARMITPMSSATARKGAQVEAAVTRPVFSADHSLLIPEGSRLLGEIVQVQPARFFHRNGKMLFVFRQIRSPAGAAQVIQGRLEGVEADFDAHLGLDLEGATHATSTKARFIFPAIAIATAGLSFHQDYNAQGIPDQDVGGRVESGAIGLGLIGTLVAQTSRALASSIAVTGAAFSIYSNFIARGRDVTLPKNTPVTVSLRRRSADVVAHSPN